MKACDFNKLESDLKNIKNGVIVYNNGKASVMSLDDFIKPLQDENKVLQEALAKANERIDSLVKYLKERA